MNKIRSSPSESRVTFEGKTYGGWGRVPLVSMMLHHEGLHEMLSAGMLTLSTGVCRLRDERSCVHLICSEQCSACTPQCYRDRCGPELLAVVQIDRK
ncbi:unnamed protein product [Arctogadus glacialis]